jgi:hypothetical protein
VISIATIIPQKYDIVDTYMAEYVKFYSLKTDATRSTSGNVSWTSSTSSITYDTSVGTGIPSYDTNIIGHGDSGLMWWLSFVLSTYIVSASDFNGVIYDINLSSSDYTLSPDDYYKRKLIVSVGADSSHHLILPNAYLEFTIINADTSHAVSVKKSGGSAILIPAGDTATVCYNGTNYIFASHGSKTTQTLENKTLTSPIIRSWNTWQPIIDTWTYASPTTITVPAGAASIYSVNDKIRLKQGGAYKYYYITTVADTLLTVNGNTVTPASITDIYYSKSQSPVGYPSLNAITPTIYTGNNVTLVGRSYNTIATLPAGKYMVFVSYFGSTSAIICSGGSFANGYGDVVGGSSCLIIELTASTTIQLYVNADDTANYVFYRLKINTVRIS